MEILFDFFKVAHGTKVHQYLVLRLLICSLNICDPLVLLFAYCFERHKKIVIVIIISICLAEMDEI